MNNLFEDSLKKLIEKNIPNPELDLRILLKHALYKKKEVVLSNIKIDEIDISHFNLLLSKRLNFEPISKIIKKKYFWKSKFFVNSNVLDPRPETELIVEEVLNITNDKNKKLKILDIGTGSGCLAISIAQELKNSKVTAIDISDKAIDVARKNINLHNLRNKIKLKSIELDKIKNKFDIVVSNPPYLSENEYKNLNKQVINFEPKVAFLGGKDGLKFYKLFASILGGIMKQNSYFICEIGHNQLNQCKEIFAKTNLKLIKVTKDFQKIDRTLTFLKI